MENIIDIEEAIEILRTEIICYDIYDCEGGCDFCSLFQDKDTVKNAMRIVVDYYDRILGE